MINKNRGHFLAIALTVAAVACGGSTGKTDTASPGDTYHSPDGGTQQDPSVEAAKAFAKATTAYERKKADGTLTVAECEKVSNSFARAYRKHGDQLIMAGFNAAAVWDECGDTAKAEALYQPLVKKNFSLAINNLGVIYWNKGQTKKALDLFKRSVEADRKKSHYARNNLAAAHRDKYKESPSSSDFELAEKTLQNVLAVDSSNKMAYENLARLYYDRGRLKDSSYLLLAGLVMDQARRVLDKRGEESSAIANLRGLLFMEDNNQFEALLNFKDAVRIDPSNADANLNIALISIRFRDFATAEKSLAITLKDPSQKLNVEAYLAMGVAKRGLKKFGEAKKFFAKAAKINAKDPRPEFNLGVLYQEHMIGQDGVDQKKMEEFFNVAKKHYQTATSKSGGNSKWKEISVDSKQRVVAIDEAIATFRMSEELARKAKELEAAAKKQEEEERQRLLKLEEEAMKAEQSGSAAAATPETSTAKPATKKDSGAKKSGAAAPKSTKKK